MSGQLVILLGQSPDAPIRWGRFDGGRLIEGGRIEGAEGLPELSAAAEESDRVAALLPGEQVACRKLAAAPRGTQRVRAAARYLMDDELAESVDGLEVAVTADRTPAQILAVRKPVLDEWIAALAEAGIDCDLISADFAVLPSSDGAATILAEPGRIVFAIDGAGAAIERDLFPAIATEIFAGAPLKVGVLGEASFTRQLPEEAGTEWLGEADEARVLSVYADGVSGAAPANFMRRPFINRRRLAATLAPWRRAGMLAAGLAVVAFIGMIIDGAANARDAARWREAARSLHTEFFPEAADADPVAFARRRLNEGVASVTFLDLAARFADAAEANDDVQIDRIRYNQARGEFVVTISSASDRAIESFRQALSVVGVEARDSGGFRNNGGVWSGELTARAQ